MTPQDSTTVVLLHGCGGSTRATFALTGWLAAIAAVGHRVVAPDLPGHGRRRVSHQPTDYSDLAGMVAQSLPDGPFDAVGFSLGSKLLLELALRQPGRIRRMVLGGIGDNVFAPEVIAPIAADGLEFPRSDAAKHPAVKAMLRHWEPDLNDALAVAAVLRRPANPVFTPDRVRKLMTPVLIVNGAKDPVGRLGNVLETCLPGLRIETLPAVDHFGLPAQPAFRRLAFDFLGMETP